MSEVSTDVPGDGAEPVSPAPLPQRRDPDLARPPAPTDVEGKLAQTDLAIRARKLRHMEEQRKLVEQANEITRAPRG